MCSTSKGGGGPGRRQRAGEVGVWHGWADGAGAAGAAPSLGCRVRALKRILCQEDGLDTSARALADQSDHNTVRRPQ